MATITKRWNEPKKNQPGCWKWTAQVRMGGQHSTKTFADKIEARKWADKVEENIRSGKSVGAGLHTLEDLIDFFTKTELKPPRYKDTAHKKIKAHWAWWVAQFGENTLLANITKERIGDAVSGLKLGTNSLSRKKLEGATVNKYLDSLSVLLEVAAMKLYWIDENPIRKVPKEEVGESRKRWLTEAEQKTLLTTALQKSTRGAGPRLWLWIKTALSTGARAAEIAQLTWSDIDFANNQITIRGTTNEIGFEGEVDPDEAEYDAVAGGTKTKLTRVVLLHPEVKAALEKLKKGDVVPVDIFGSFPKKPYLAAIRNSGLRHGKGGRSGRIVFHTLRHTCATMLAKSGAEAYDLQQYMGWKTQSMADRYVHKTGHLSPRLRDIVNVLL